MKVVLLLAEMACAASIAVGAGMIFLPAGLIVAGVLGVLAFEHADKRVAGGSRERGT